MDGLAVSDNTEKKARDSGIDLLKIIGIFLVVLCHSALTVSVSYPENIVGNTNAFFDSTLATTDIKMSVVSFFRNFGSIGNDIFWVCSFWFLVESKKLRASKIFQMIFDVWIISVAFLTVSLCMGTNIGNYNIIKSIFPTSFSNNWFITQYLLIYAVHPLLNTLIDKIPSKRLFELYIMGEVSFLL